MTACSRSILLFVLIATLALGLFAARHNQQPVATMDSANVVQFLTFEGYRDITITGSRAIMGSADLSGVGFKAVSPSNQIVSGVVTQSHTIYVDGAALPFLYHHVD